MPDNQVVNPGWKRFEKMTFSPAIKSGNMLFISGIAATDDEGNVMHNDDMVAQTRVIYQKMEAILKEAGASFDNVVKTIDYITTVENYKKTAIVRREFFKNRFPASTGVVVKSLLKKGVLIEIEAVCVLD